MNNAGFCEINGGTPAHGYIYELTTTNNGIVLSPDPLGGGFQDVSGVIALAVDLKTVNGNFALGFNNWQSQIPIGSSNLVVGNVNMANMVGDENIAIGNNNMANVVAPSVLNNIAIGSRVMQRMASGNHDNISIGQALGVEVGNNNIIMGQDSGYYLIGNDNIIQGKNIASGNTVVGSNNILLSKDVFTLPSSQVESTILLGNDNMTATLISDGDIVIGSNNLQQMGNSNHNLIIGHNILTDATIAGNDNIYIGRRLNQNVNESITNILIGTDIEFASTDKRNCIVIGQTITLPPETIDQTTIIGGSHIALGNNITAPTYKLESGQSRCMHNLNQTSNYDFRYMEFLNSGPLNMVGVSNDVFTFNLNQLQFPAGAGFRMLTLEIVFNCTYYVEPPGFDPSDVYHSSSCTLGLIYNSQTTTWNLMQLQSGYQEPSNIVDCNNNNNQVAFNMAVPYITTIGKYIPYQIVQDQVFLSGANDSTLTYNIQMNTGFANSGVGGYSCMYKFYTSMGID